MIRLSPLGRAELELPRRRLSERLRALGIRDERVLEAIASVPRHLLIPEPLRGQAYKDISLPIGAGQTISAPSTVAAMTQALQPTGSETVLEVGTGSGYQAAILSRLVARVVSIERVPQLAARARTALDTLGVTNVVVHLGDGTAGGPEVPQPLLAQLAPGGCLVGPFGARERQKLIRMRCDGRGNFSREELGPCRFVELLGTHGWAAA